MANSLIIVDDDEAVQAQVRQYLSEYPVLVRSARNGQEAIEILRAEGPVDLVLLDLAMPIMDGVLFLEAIRSERRQANPADQALADRIRDMPVIVISATDDRDEIMSLKKYRPAGFIMKPIKKDLLIQRVESVLKTPLKKSPFPDVDIMLDL